MSGDAATHAATPPGVLRAGEHDQVVLTASLVPPGASVWLGDGAPDGLAAALDERGCPRVDRGEADLIVVGPHELAEGRPAIVTAPNLDHGSVAAGAPPPPGAVDEATLLAAIARTGHEPQETVRTFAPFPADGPGAALQADPRRWVTWQAVLAAPDALAPPPPRPDHVPDRTVLVLATAAFAQWARPRRELLLALHDVAVGAGARLVLSWDDLRLTGSLAAHVDLARAGMVLHGGDGVFDVEGTSAGVVAPDARALVNAYEPDVVVVLDRERLDTSLAIGAAEVPEARMLGIDVAGAPLEERVPSAAAARRVEELLATPAAPGASDIAVVERRPRRAGVTSVVIPVHGRWDLTGACLDSIRAHTGPPVELIVVDNASPDQTPQRLAEQADVRTITCTTNLGFAGGTNLGLQAATGEWVCLLNNDTEVVPGWLQRLQDALAIEGTGIVGPRSNSISGLQLLPGAPQMDDPAAARRWAREAAADGGDRTWRIQRLVGFAMLLRGDLLEEVGGLDVGVGLGNYEDDDLCQRVRRRGLHLRVADGSVVLHHGSATFAGARIDALRTARQGARHLGDRLTATSDLLVARIAANRASPEDVEEVASTVWVLADELVVLCDGPTLPQALRSRKVNRRAVAVLPDDPATHQWRTSAPWVLHLDGRTPVDHRHWGVTRAAVEALPRHPHGIVGLPGSVLAPVVDGTVGPPPSPDGLPMTDVIRPA